MEIIPLNPNKEVVTTNKFQDLCCRFSVFCQQHKNELALGVVVCGVLLVTLTPEQACAVKLEEQLDAANTLITDKVKKYGVIGASIAGGIWAIFKGNLKQAGVIVGIGIILSYYLKWVQAGMNL